MIQQFLLLKRRYEIGVQVGDSKNTKIPWHCEWFSPTPQTTPLFSLSVWPLTSPHFLFVADYHRARDLQHLLRHSRLWRPSNLRLHHKRQREWEVILSRLQRERRGKILWPYDLWPYDLVTLWPCDLMTMWYDLATLWPYDHVTLFDLMTLWPFDMWPHDLMTLWPLPSQLIKVLTALIMFFTHCLK